MITFLQSTGRTALQDALSSGVKLQFTSFRVGNAPIIEPDVSYTDAQAPIVYTGAESEIKYVPNSTDSVTLQLIIGADKPQIAITNVMLFVGDGIPFCFCFNFTNDKSFLKLGTVDNATGIRWMLQLELRLPAILDYFSFDNIATNAADIVIIPDEATLNSDFAFNGRDQGVLSMHAGLGRAVPLLVVGNTVYGNPFAFASDDPLGFRIDGGDDGDNYKYTYDPNEDWVLAGGIWDDDLRWRDSSTWED